MKKIGVISDTHSLLRKEAVKIIKGSDLILHAGDIGNLSVIQELEKIAPVKAIRGNVDKKEWANLFPKYETLEIEGKFIYMIHKLSEMDIDPFGQFDAVVFGHSHNPHNEVKNNVLYFNPGSAGPRRFDLPITIGKLIVSRSGISGEIIKLE